MREGRKTQDRRARRQKPNREVGGEGRDGTRGELKIDHFHNAKVRAERNVPIVGEGREEVNEKESRRSISRRQWTRKNKKFKRMEEKGPKLSSQKEKQLVISMARRPGFKA